MKNGQTLFLAILRGYLWVIMVLGLAAPAVIFGSFRSAFRERANLDLTRSARALIPLVESHLAEGWPADLDSVVNAMGPGMNARITVISRNGNVIADSERYPGEMENHRTRVEVISALNGLPGSSSRFSETLGREMLYAAVPVIHGDSVVAVVRTSFFFDSHSAALQPILKKMWFVIAAALTIALASAWLISRRISIPMSDLADVAERVKNGDLGARAAPGDTREHRILAGTMNSAFARNEELIRDLSSSNGRNSAILRSMSEGVAVVSRSGRMLLANESFKSLFRAGDSPGRLPEEVSEVFLKRGRACSGRLEFEGSVLGWASAPVENTTDTVFSFADITREFQLSELKRNFAINVSHELRTPLTAIKGYAETMKEDAEAQSGAHLDVILRNTDRLIALVEDIQTLSEVEAGVFIRLEETSVESLRDTVMPLFTARAREKGLDLDFVSDRPGQTLMADRYRLEQVLVNLVDNAVKYTDEGRVEVRVSVRSGMAVFAVSDTGRGIAAEYQGRVFERFFVVDRSRSRKMGGTGLGLAIAKHIVEAHGGSISISSRPGQGSIFVFSIPIQP